MARSPPTPPAALDHLALADEPARLLELLEKDIATYEQMGCTDRLTDWLRTLRGHFGTLPYWAEFHDAKLATARGDWEFAKASLDRASSAIGSLPADMAWRHRAAVFLAYGELLWRRGTHAEARTYARRGLDVLAAAADRDRYHVGSDDGVVTLRGRLVDLVGRVAMEVGNYARARTVLKEALTAGGTGNQHFVASVEASLALNALRGGRANECVAHATSGLAAATEAKIPALMAILNARLGRAADILGQAQRAKAAAKTAVALARESGDPRALVEALCTAAEFAVQASDSGWRAAYRRG